MEKPGCCSRAFSFADFSLPLSGNPKLRDLDADLLVRLHQHNKCDATVAQAGSNCRGNESQPLCRPTVWLVPPPATSG
jgi:hypothetical protein